MPTITDVAGQQRQLRSLQRRRSNVIQAAGYACGCYCFIFRRYSPEARLLQTRKVAKFLGGSRLILDTVSLGQGALMLNIGVGICLAGL